MCLNVCATEKRAWLPWRGYNETSSPLSPHIPIPSQESTELDRLCFLLYVSGQNPNSIH